MKHKKNTDNEIKKSRNSDVEFAEEGVYSPNRTASNRTNKIYRKNGKIVLSDPAIITVSALSGIISGVFGAMGGIIVMYIASRVNPPDTADKLRDNYAMSLTVTVTVSLFSVLIYALRGNIAYDAALPALIPSAAGGIAGAILCDRLPASILRLFFAAVTIWAGIRMIIGG